MSIVVVGLNHKTSPISLLERLAIPDERHTKALGELMNSEHVTEGVILSTCNRVEVYASVTKFHPGAQGLRNFLSEFCHVAPEDFSDHLYTYFDEGAVAHLFRVAAGVDSLVVGESEILGQVRRAVATAEEEECVGRNLRRAFSQALSVGKRARSETDISRNPVSVSSAAVELARRAFPGDTLENKKVVIVGAGKMGRLAVEALQAAGVSETIVVNRGEERAQSLADAYGVQPRTLAELPEALAEADIVICSTMASGAVVDYKTARAAMDRRERPKSLFIVDIAVPRDVDRAVAEIEGIVLRDIEDLRALVTNTVGGRLGEMAKVEDIITTELERFARWERALEVAPAIARLVDRSEALRVTEMDRFASHLAGLTDEQRDAVDQLTRRLVNKILHTPLSKSKEIASSTQGHVYLDALYELFELDDDADS
ncbi:MAG: glutamyl-tRNA reductase [Actinobacteria bacterium]|jgi:glutamyl-tRNA reductase|nr:glutamyl-tRNA reductase [Actinomycetota bacterium]